MNILLQEIKDYYESLLKLGFILNEEDILNINIDKNDVRVTFKNYIDYQVKDVTKKLNDINPEDVVNAYNLKNGFAENEQEEEEYLNAFKVIAEVMKYDEEKIRLNNILVQEFKKANNSGKFDFILVDENKETRLVKQEEVQEDSELIKKAKQFIKNNSLYVLSAAILIGAIGYAASRYNTKNTITNENKSNIETSFDENASNDTMNENIEEEIVEPTINENINEEENETIIDETNNDNLDIHSEEAIASTVNKAYEAILATNNETLISQIDKDTVEGLVRYAHQYDENYKGIKIFNHEDAYALLNMLYDQKFNISVFFENLNCYEDLDKICITAFNIDQENDSYEDEYQAYLAVDNALNNLNNNFSEALAIRAITDYEMHITSMIIARDGMQEEGIEGSAYQEEKAKASSIVSECKAIYNKIDFYNQDAILTQAVNNAFEAEEIELNR